MDMEETSTPADFLDHEPSKQEKVEVGKFFSEGTFASIETEKRYSLYVEFLREIT